MQGRTERSSPDWLQGWSLWDRKCVCLIVLFICNSFSFSVPCNGAVIWIVPVVLRISANDWGFERWQRGFYFHEIKLSRGPSAHSVSGSCLKSTSPTSFAHVLFPQEERSSSDSLCWPVAQGHFFARPGDVGICSCRREGGQQLLAGGRHWPVLVAVVPGYLISLLTVKMTALFPCHGAQPVLLAFFFTWRVCGN